MVRLRFDIFAFDEPYVRCPLRRLFQDASKLAGELGVAEGQTVLDVGAGFGYFTLEAARRVGPSGIVYAVEPNSRRAAAIREACEKRRIGWVFVLEEEVESLAWSDRRPADSAIMLLSLHHVRDRAAALRSVYHAMRPGGVLLVVEPRSDRLLGHGSIPRQVVSAIREAGFEPSGIRCGLFGFKLLARKPGG